VPKDGPQRARSDLKQEQDLLWIRCLPVYKAAAFPQELTDQPKDLRHQGVQVRLQKRQKVSIVKRVHSKLIAPAEEDILQSLLKRSRLQAVLPKKQIVLRGLHVHTTVPFAKLRVFAPSSTSSGAPDCASAWPAKHQTLTHFITMLAKSRTMTRSHLHRQVGAESTAGACGDNL